MSLKMCCRQCFIFSVVFWCFIVLLKCVVVVDAKRPVFQLWTNDTIPKRPKDILGVNDIIREAGATTEVYKVVSEDGYILQLTRLVNLDGVDMSSKEGRGTPVLLIHGNVASFDIWITRGKKYDLAFLLMDLGYDVWLCDKRGNYYTKHHVTLSASDHQFWDFSNHEPGLYDLPAFIDTIIEITRRPKVALIGHSLGTTDFYVLCSMRPEYNQKVLISVSLAPLGSRLYSSDVSSILIRLALAIGEPFIKFYLDIGLKEMSPRTSKMINAIKQFCGIEPTQDYCLDMLGMVFGENRKNINKKHITTMLTRFPASGSTKANHHLGQILLRGFRQYDEGSIGNMKKYGAKIPPSYPVHKITAPTIFYYGLNDQCVSIKGIKELARQIPGVIDVRPVRDPKFTHIDFVFGENGKEVLYPDILKVLKKYVYQQNMTLN